MTEAKLPVQAEYYLEQSTLYSIGLFKPLTISISQMVFVVLHVKLFQVLLELKHYQKH